MINISTKTYDVGNSCKILCSVVNKKFLIRVLKDDIVVEESGSYDADLANAQFKHYVEKYRGV